MLNIHRARLNPEYVPAVNKQQMGTVAEVPDPGSAFIATFLERWIDRGEGWKARHVGVLGYQGGTLDAVVEHVNLKVLGLNEVDIQWKSQREIVYVTVTCGHGSEVQNHDRAIETSLPFIIFEHHFGLVLVLNRTKARQLTALICLVSCLPTVTCFTMDESDRNKLGDATDSSDQDKDKVGTSSLSLTSRLLEETLKNMPAEDIDGEVEEVPQTYHKLSWSSPLITQFYDKLGQQNTK
ncbi:hypothetical protein GG344DRAFT_69626 [Lentinula edodes]|nr:hypothetical protein GG344DRAFT_69626 [Lentinula edodes]